MTARQRLVVLDADEGGRRGPLALERRKILTAIVEAGGKVRHDSGGRFLVVDLPVRAGTALSRQLPQLRVLPLGSADELAGAARDESEALFLKALRIRTSQTYRTAKRRRKVGDTPEEKALVSGSCVREDY